MKVNNYYQKIKFFSPSKLKKLVSIILILLILLVTFFAFWWDKEPQPVSFESLEKVYTVSVGIKLIDTLLNKRGGYLSNDVFLPGIIMDNIPSWEFGAILVLRDYLQALRNDFSRSQSLSSEDANLVIAHTKFNIDHTSWLFPSAESEYQDSLENLQTYHHNLKNNTAKFYIRADNLVAWLKLVEKRLGDIGQALGKVKSRSILGNAQGEITQEENVSWFRIDNNFYQARGESYILLHLFKAIKLDFQEVLKDKKANLSLDQLIRELESSQKEISSLFILNGDEFGILNNHSLILSSYLAKAQAATSNLISLLENG